MQIDEGFSIRITLVSSHDKVYDYSANIQGSVSHVYLYIR